MQSLQGSWHGISSDVALFIVSDVDAIVGGTHVAHAVAIGANTIATVSENPRTQVRMVRVYGIGGIKAYYT